MKKYLIERFLPGAGKLSPKQLQEIAQESSKILNEMGPTIHWVESFVVANRIYCIYLAENEDLLREHAKRGGFPLKCIGEVTSVISPATAEVNPCNNTDHDGESSSRQVFTGKEISSKREINSRDHSS